MIFAVAVNLSIFIDNNLPKRENTLTKSSLSRINLSFYCYKDWVKKDTSREQNLSGIPDCDNFFRMSSIIC